MHLPRRCSKPLLTSPCVDCGTNRSKYNVSWNLLMRSRILCTVLPTSGAWCVSSYFQMLCRCFALMHICWVQAHINYAKWWLQRLSGHTCMKLCAWVNKSGITMNLGVLQYLVLWGRFVGLVRLSWLCFGEHLVVIRIIRCHPPDSKRSSGKRVFMLYSRHRNCATQFKHDVVFIWAAYILVLEHYCRTNFL